MTRTGLRALARDVLAPFVGSRVMLAVVAAVALRFVPPAAHEAVWDGSRLGWVNVWARWDARHYLSIAQGGYVYVPGEATNVAFAPLYPLLMRLLAAPFGGTADACLIAGILLSNLCLLAALCCLHALVRFDSDAETAARAVFLVCVFPTTLFLSAVYPMSLALLLSVAAVLLARRGRWAGAGLCAALLALCRIEGVVLVPALAWEWRATGGRRRARDLLALCLPAVAAFAGWGAFLWRLTGDPLFVLHAGRAWGRELTPPWALLADRHSAYDLASVGLLSVMVLLTWPARLRASYRLYAALYLLALLSSGLLHSSLRYGLLLWPGFVALAAWTGGRTWAERAWVPVSAGLAGLLMALYALWYPAG